MDGVSDAVMKKRAALSLERYHRKKKKWMEDHARAETNARFENPAQKPRDDTEVPTSLDKD